MSEAHEKLASHLFGFVHKPMGEADCRVSSIKTMASSRGSALILVLWIIGMLSIIVVSFAFDAHIEGKIISFSRKQLKVEALAESGMELAKSYLDRSRSITGNESDEDKEEDSQYEQANDLRLGKAVTLTYEFRNKNGEIDEALGSVRVDIRPEDSLRNINKLKDDDWERIFVAINVPEEFWPELIDSYNDWIDTDDMPRENGGETDDYYSELEKPYTAANAPFDTLGELNLVKGFKDHPAIMTGGVFNPEDPPERHVIVSNGIERLLTTYGEGKVNLNALPADRIGVAVLMSLPGVPSELEANAIFEERATDSYATTDDEETNGAFKDEADARRRLEDIVEDSAFFNYISTKSEIFRIESVGQIGRVTKRICATVYANDKIWRVLRWREEP